MSPPVFTIRAFAVACVAVTSAYVMWLGNKVNDTLSGAGWCATAFGAGKAAGTTPVKGLDACVGMLTIQLNSLSTNSHILLGTVALCLAVLIIIVIAGAKFEGHTGPGGTNINVSRDNSPTPVQVVNQPQDPVPTAQVPPPS